MGANYLLKRTKPKGRDALLAIGKFRETLAQNAETLKDKHGLYTCEGEVKDGRWQAVPGTIEKLNLEPANYE